MTKDGEVGGGRRPAKGRLSGEAEQQQYGQGPKFLLSPLLQVFCNLEGDILTNKYLFILNNFYAHLKVISTLFFRDSPLSAASPK